MSLERGDDFLGMADFGFRGGERGVDDRDLRGVDRELAGKALAARGFGFGLEALVVLEIREHAVDRLDASGDRPGKAQRSRELVGEAELALRIIFGRGAER